MIELGWLLGGLGVGAICNSMLTRTVAAVRPQRSRLLQAMVLGGISLRYVLTAGLLAMAAMSSAHLALFAAGGILLSRLWFVTQRAARDRALPE